MVVGAKALGFDFSVSDLEFKTLIAANPDYTITKSGDILISESKSDYILLSGSFTWTKLLQGDYEGGIKSLNGITVVSGGKVSYEATGLGMTGTEVESNPAFKAYLADSGYNIKGNASANELSAADRNDLVHGLSGNDTIYGMGGVDRLFGDDGADRIVGGTGNDFLTGGTGADMFVFEAGDGDDVIMDFQASGKGQDHIDLSDHSGVTSFADLDITDAGKNVLITIGDDSILLRNVSEKAVNAADFHF